MKISFSTSKIFFFSVDSFLSTYSIR
jgi:hypothetical protein